MPFVKNIAFTLLIKIDGRLREFNFRKRGDILYDVDTNDENGDRIFFKMKKQEDKWRISDAELPEWLTKNDSLISTAIVKDNSNLST